MIPLRTADQALKTTAVSGPTDTVKPHLLRALKIARLARWAVLPVFLLYAAAALQAQEEDAAAASREVRVRALAGDLRRFEPGQWAVVQVEGVNQGRKAAEAFIAVYLGDDRQMQFGRKLWIPARSRRTTWLPVFVPEDIASDETRLSLNTLVLQSGSEDQVVRRGDQGRRMVQEELLAVDHERIKTAIMLPKARSGLPLGGTEVEESFPHQTMVASREAVNQGRVFTNLTGDFLPPTPRAIDSLDQLILADDRIVNDSAGLAALRQWLHAGGRLWIMLDLVSSKTVAAVLGDSVCHEVVDRVELTEFTIEDRTQPPGAERKSQWRSERPVELLRVLTDSDDVTCTIDGWPAAFWQQVGSGEVLFTSLPARGWMFDPQFAPDTRALPALRSISLRFYQDRKPLRLPPETTRSILEERIGYRIPSRRVAFSLLGLNCAALLGIGIWLSRREQLERLAWVVPATTLSTAAVLLGIGMSNSQSVPSMMSAVELMQLDGEGKQATVSGTGAVYTQETVELPLQMQRGGIAVPESGRFSGATRRLIVDDDGNTNWHNVTIASGSVRFVEFDRTVQLDSPVTVQGQFGPDGFEGTVRTGAMDMGDMVVVSPPAPPLTVSPGADGEFASGSSQVLAPGQYLADTILSDEQRRRQTLYRGLFSRADLSRLPADPTLFAWTSNGEFGVGLPEDFERSGSLVAAIPLQIARTPAGSPFQVPATFIDVESARGQKGVSTVYRAQTGEWMQEVLSATNMALRFVLPEQVRPCRLQRVVLTVKINAPSRTLKITRPHGKQPVVIHELDNPSGVLRFEIEDPEALQLDAGGGLPVGIAVSETTGQRAEKAGAADRELLREQGTASQSESRDNSTWQIDYVRLDAFGRTTD